MLINILFRFKRRRRKRPIRYLKSEDDHLQQLNLPITSPDHHHHGKNLQAEPTYLASSSPTILPSGNNNNNNRPHSASSTTSSIIMHQNHDGQSDLESLIKPVNPQSSHTNKDIDNFYEEIKEQQHQTALALNGNKMNEKRSIFFILYQIKCFFEGQASSSAVPPIRDHHEVFYYECEE